MDAVIWTTTVASLIAVVLNIRKHRVCFAIWLGTNLSWAVIDFTHKIYGQAFLQAIYAGLSVWGLIEWRRGGNQRQDDDAHESETEDTVE